MFWRKVREFFPQYIPSRTMMFPLCMLLNKYSCILENFSLSLFPFYVPFDFLLGLVNLKQVFQYLLHIIFFYIYHSWPINKTYCPCHILETHILIVHYFLVRFLMLLHRISFFWLRKGAYFFIFTD